MTHTTNTNDTALVQAALQQPQGRPQALPKDDADRGSAIAELWVEDLPESHTVHTNGGGPLSENMKESTRPTLAIAIEELVRLRQLAQAAGQR